mmetsp:Transcript_1378/g.2985  ORF Transcript_1378/g.2985 Transcript_1378/m.2985 type:complete len:1168 (+) Transcript_1378:302-3805(+)
MPTTTASPPHRNPPTRRRRRTDERANASTTTSPISSTSRSSSSTTTTPFGYYEELRRLLIEGDPDDSHAIAMDQGNLLHTIQVQDLRHDHPHHNNNIYAPLESSLLDNNTTNNNNKTSPPPPYLLHLQTTTSITDNQDSTTSTSSQEVETLHILNIAVAMGLSQSPYGPDPFLGLCGTLLLAAHQFNNNNNSINQHCPKNTNLKLIVDFYDTGNPLDPTQAAAVLRKSIHPRAWPYQYGAVIGAMTSRATLPLALLNSWKQIPQVSFASTSTELDEKQSYPYLARTIPGSDADAKAVTAYLQQQLRSTHVVILSMQDDVYATRYRITLEREFQRAGMMTQTVGLSFVVQTETDATNAKLRESARAAVQQLVTIGYQHFVAIVTPHHLVHLIEYGAPEGLFGPNHFWLCTDSIRPWIRDKATVRQMATMFRFDRDSPQARALQGLALLAAGTSQEDGQGLMESYRDTLLSEENAEAFGDYFHSKSPQGYEFPSNFSGLPDNQMDPLRLGQWDYFAHDAVTTLGMAACQALSHKSADGGESIQGPDVLAQLANISFDGVSGRVELDPDTLSRKIKTTTFVLTNTFMSDVGPDGKVGFKAEIVAEYSHDDRHDDDDDDHHHDEEDSHTDHPTNQEKKPKPKPYTRWKFINDIQGFNYSDFSTTPPKSLPFLQQQNSFRGGGAIKAAFLVFTTAGAMLMLTSIGFAVWTFWYRNSYVIRTSQPGFLIMLCVGTFFMALSIVTLSFGYYLPSQPWGDHTDPSHFDHEHTTHEHDHGVSLETYNINGVVTNDGWARFSCMATHWFFNFGFGLAFSALFAKMWRINKILGDGVEHFRRVVVQPKDVMVPGIIIVLGNLLILLCWQIMDPLRFVWRDEVESPVDKFGRYTEQTHMCVSEKGYDSWFIAALYLLDGGTILAANVQAYRARHVSTEFSESVYIAYAMAIIFQAVLISVPVFLYENPEDASSYYAKSIIYVIIVSTMIILIFVPKAGFWLRQRRASKLIRLQQEEMMKEEELDLRPIPEALDYNAEDEAVISNEAKDNGSIQVATFAQRPSSLTLLRKAELHELGSFSGGSWTSTDVRKEELALESKPVLGSFAARMVLSSDMSSSYQTNGSEGDLRGPVLTPSRRNTAALANLMAGKPPASETVNEEDRAASTPEQTLESRETLASP